jgi:hypothetical protein
MIPSAQWSSQGASAALRSDAPPDSASNMQANAPNPKPNLQSCQFCRKRKIKCDKLDGGCSQCSRAQNECVYPASQRKGRPRKAGIHRPAPASTPREAQLWKKIWKLERLVANLAGASPPVGSEGNVNTMVRETLRAGTIPYFCSHKQDHLPIDDDEASQMQLGRLVIGKSYLNDTFWSHQVSDNPRLVLGAINWVTPASAHGRRPRRLRRRE